MFESVLTTILSIAGVLLSGTISFVLGQRAERNKQSLLIRAEMLAPINEWLKGAEKMVGILADTMSSVALNAPLPVHYNFDERLKASNFMSEKTNEVMGIISSGSLKTRKTRRLEKDLKQVIMELDQLIKFELLPRESEIVGRYKAGSLSEKYMLETGKVKLHIDSLLQQAYSLVARIKSKLT